MAVKKYRKSQVNKTSNTPDEYRLIPRTALQPAKRKLPAGRPLTLTPSIIREAYNLLLSGSMKMEAAFNLISAQHKLADKTPWNWNRAGKDLQNSIDDMDETDAGLFEKDLNQYEKLQLDFYREVRSARFTWAQMTSGKIHKAIEHGVKTMTYTFGDEELDKNTGKLVREKIPKTEVVKDVDPRTILEIQKSYLPEIFNVEQIELTVSGKVEHQHGVIDLSGMDGDVAVELMRLRREGKFDEIDKELEEVIDVEVIVDDES